jgi:hypothetical protein
MSIEACFVDGFGVVTQASLIVRKLRIEWAPRYVPPTFPKAKPKK